MAYAVNWITRVITIPVSDLISEGGANYSLSADSFWRELRRLEWEFSEGLWAPPILEHTDPETLSGIPQPTRNKIINGYTVTFDPTAEKVFLRGDINNVVDIFNYNGVSVIPTNAGSALTPSDASKLDELWQMRGLDTDRPVTITPTLEQSTGIDIAVTGDGVNTSTLTRQ